MVKEPIYFSADVVGEHGASCQGPNYAETDYFDQHHCSARMSEISLFFRA